jgi:hypothetical protein
MHTGRKARLRAHGRSAAALKWQVFSESELWLVSFLILLGAVLWADVLTRFVDVGANSNPMAIRFRQTMDELNRFMARRRLPCTAV